MMICRWEIIAQRMTFPTISFRRTIRSKEKLPKIPFSDSVSFYETLKEQLDMQDLTPEEKQLGEYLIGSLDDDGLLRKTTEALMDELAIYQVFIQL